MIRECHCRRRQLPRYVRAEGIATVRCLMGATRGLGVPVLPPAKRDEGG